MQPLRALSIRQPWVHAILHHGKDVENRTRVNPHRGATLIHASAGMSVGEYHEAMHWMVAAGVVPSYSTITPSMLDRGGIVGIMDVVDSVTTSDSPWYMGRCAFVLRNVRALPFIPCRGTVAPLFWLPDAETQRRVAELLSA